MLLEQMSNGLVLPTGLVRGVARKANHAYKSYVVPKRSGGGRLIHHPSRELKALQRWLLGNVIDRWQVHECAVAYRAGRGIRFNADQHRDSWFLLRMDLECFFPSITENDIRLYLESFTPPGAAVWTPDDVELFLRLVCIEGCLTVGAPTSPALSNAICYELDHRLNGAAQEREVRYTRYADDLFFSTRQRDVLGLFVDEVRDIVQQIDIPAQLRINEKKTRHSSRKGCRRVTGLVLSTDATISIGRSRKRYIRRQIHRYDGLTQEEKRELAGLLAFAQDVEPDLLNRLILKYGPGPIASARKSS